MPKKSRRAKARRRVPLPSTVQERRPQLSRQVSTQVQSASRVATKAQDLASRYQYVVPELKRIGIIAGAIVVVLIILSFILG